MIVTPQNQTKPKPHKTKPNKTKPYTPLTTGHVMLSCGSCMIVFGLCLVLFALCLVWFSFGSEVLQSHHDDSRFVREGRIREPLGLVKIAAEGREPRKAAEILGVYVVRINMLCVRNSYVWPRCLCLGSRGDVNDGLAGGMAGRQRVWWRMVPRNSCLCSLCCFSLSYSWDVNEYGG